MCQRGENRGMERGARSIELVQDENSTGDAIPWASGKVRVCEARERMAYLLTCLTVAKHLSFVLLLPLLSL